MPDPVADFLRSLNTSDRARAAAWDAVYSVGDDAQAQQVLQQLPFSNEVRAQLWDARKGAAIKPMNFDRPPLKAETPTLAERAGYGMPGDVVTGFAKGAAHTALDLGQAVHAIPGVSKGVDALYGTPGLSDAAFKDARATTAYANNAQRAGGVAETIAELAIPVTKAAEAVPSTARAGRAFESVMGAAKDIPLDVSEPGKVALRIADMAQRGGGTNWGPPPVRQFIQYITDPKKPDMTYEVARDFASNISRLSSKDLASVPPAMMREIGELRMTLNKAIGEAAQQVGKLGDYEAAMKEYAQAAKVRDAAQDIVKGFKRGLPFASGTAAGHYAYQKLHDLFNGE
jgi:hypothetical protein